MHPENAGKDSEVLLSLLGKFRLDSKGGGGTTPPAPPAATTAALTVPGWTSVTVSTNNIALFYNAANGDAATARVNADGTLTQLADKNTLGAYRTGWTQIVQGPQNTLFFYNRANGATNLSVAGEDGIVSTLYEYSPFSPIWSIIAIDPATHKMLFYSDKDGTEGVANLNLNNGEVETLQSYPGTLKPGDFRWTNIMAIGNDLWFRYNTGNGQGYTYRYAADGSGYGLVSFETGRTWSSIASNVANMYFFDKTNGKAMSASVGADGKFTPLKTYEGLSREWTHIAAVPNGPFLIYSSTTGNIATDKIAADGSVTALKRYSPC